MALTWANIMSAGVFTLKSEISNVTFQVESLVFR